MFNAACDTKQHHLLTETTTMAHDPRPQASIRTTSGADQTEPVGPYVDRSLTKRNPANDDAPASYSPEKSGSTTLGEIVVYDKPGTDHTPGDQGATVPPHSPNSWTPGRDYYKNNGMVGQDFTQNQGG
jgi:hypothetical protein